MDEVVRVGGIQGLGDLAEKVYDPPGAMGPSVLSNAPISTPPTRRMSINS